MHPAGLFGQNVAGSKSEERKMAELIFFHNPMSRARIVHWMLEEVGVPYTTRLIRFDTGEHKQPDFLAVNPMGKLPAIKHGDTVVTEAAAICAYLADAFPKAGAAASPFRGVIGQGSREQLEDLVEGFAASREILFVTGAGNGGSPHVTVFAGTTRRPISSSASTSSAVSCRVYLAAPNVPRFLHRIESPEISSQIPSPRRPEPAIAGL